MKKAKNREDNKVEYGTISLPIPLIEKIKKRISGTGISSVSAYVAFVLRQILSSSSGAVFSKEEEQNVKDRLKSLGY